MSLYEYSRQTRRKWPCYNSPDEAYQLQMSTVIAPGEVKQYILDLRHIFGLTESGEYEVWIKEIIQDAEAKCRFIVTK